ncbi:hypothetical protein BX600DRAFT_467671 [Xylariales sp. PMI_506]|nr:hypothetical protein BX600DRAFT_467671 [Xylariales sp. PMI_506]
MDPPDAAVAQATSPSAPSATPQELESRAKAFIAQEQFNRSFTLAATEAHGELNVTYAVGGVDSAAAATLLFIGGMFGGRYMATMADHLGKKLGVRVVVTDRPGLGRSTPVDPPLRISVWLETVPALMRVLGVQHVSLACHSCGIIYALNTLYSMPWILPPSKRKLYVFSPWVSPDHSGVGFLTVSSFLPSALINNFDSVVRFVNRTVAPTIAFSGMISSAVAAPFTSTSTDIGEATDGSGSAARRERERLYLESWGIPLTENTARSEEIMRAVFSEDTSGANHEALLSLKKQVAGSWGICDNYETYPSALETKLREFLHQPMGGENSPPAEHPTTTVDANDTAEQHTFSIKAFWAATDMMIGKQGEKYFDKCFEFFRSQDTDGGSDNQYLLYESETVPDTDHETLCLPHKGALSRVLEDMTT